MPIPTATSSDNLKAEMSASFFFLKAFFLFFHRIFSRKFRTGLQRNLSIGRAGHRKYQNYPSLAKRPDLSDQTLLFNVEAALLRSSSPFFSYFMLVAFEAGSILRALLLFLSYPLVRLVGREMGLKIMVMISFFGIRKDTFRAGTAVLPKFFLNDVGLEAFEVLRRGGKRMAFSNIFPQVMIESFLRDYLEIEVVVGRELKVFRGYFVGLMEEKANLSSQLSVLEEEEEEADEQTKLQSHSNTIGISGCQKGYEFHLLSSMCNEVYTVSEVEKKRWQKLPSEKLPKPLIFHDGRLALNPTPLESVALFMWLPFALILAILRAFASLSLPYSLCIPINAFSGMRLTVSNPTTTATDNGNENGHLYVCNHRTLLDPLFISAALNINNPSAVTYSLSPVSEFFSPIKTVRLTRNRDRDAELMAKMLKDGNLIVCPEGTTCREPYLLRFSPLFSEVGTTIYPVANDTHVSMFYGTTAGGFKCFDPIFFVMNPMPSYIVKKLEMVSGSSALQDDQKSSTRFDVANRVQSEIAKALEFECTNLTRRDKYLILAGNEGIVHSK